MYRVAGFAVAAAPVVSCTTSKMEPFDMWTTPIVREIAVGLEINCYACADL